MLTLAKHYERHGGDPRLWLATWARDKKIEKDREKRLAAERVMAARKVPRPNSL
jgi:hypothetical protein